MSKKNIKPFRQLTVLIEYTTVFCEIHYIDQWFIVFVLAYYYLAINCKFINKHVNRGVNVKHNLWRISRYFEYNQHIP